MCLVISIRHSIVINEIYDALYTINSSHIFGSFTELYYCHFYIIFILKTLRAHSLEKQLKKLLVSVLCSYMEQVVSFSVTTVDQTALSVEKHFHVEKKIILDCKDQLSFFI